MPYPLFSVITQPMPKLHKVAQISKTSSMQLRTNHATNPTCATLAVNKQTNDGVEENMIMCQDLTALRKYTKAFVFGT